MDQPNVNNLNGVGNFGHGFQDQVMEEQENQPLEETEQATPEEDEEVEITNEETE